MCGAGIEVYWVRLDDDIIDLGPPIDIEGFDGNREHDYLWTNSVLKIGAKGADGPVEIAGGAYVHDDEYLLEENETRYRDLFRDAENDTQDGRPARLFQNLSERVSDRYPGLLERLVKLALVSRWGRVYPPQSGYYEEVYCSVPKAGPAEASMDKDNYKLEGAFVAVTGLAEEGAYISGPDHYDQGEFENVLEYAVAHELCHLLVGNKHPAKGDSTALMGDPPGLDVYRR